jgi:hypothetical protein
VADDVSKPVGGSGMSCEEDDGDNDSVKIFDMSKAGFVETNI